MSSPEVCGPDGVHGYPETPKREGPDKIPVVTKSISLHEMRQRPSLRDISECYVTGEGGNSSGVFSCSVDISDVCMADLTKLSDSTVCSSSESIGREARPHVLGSAVMSTPLAPQARSIASSDVLTPMRSQSDFLSPQFGANDDYLRRNIKFIYRQLGSLMTQLRTEDKYFQTCTQRYEEVIANLEDEIIALKSAKIDQTQNLSTLEKSASNLKNEYVENAKDSSHERDTKTILQRIAHDLLPQLHSMVQSTSANLPGAVDPWVCDIDTKEDNFNNLTTVFEKCLAQLDKVIKAFNGTATSQSCDFQDLSNRMENTKLTDSGTESLSSFQEEVNVKNQICALENKLCELEAANDSLRTECRESREEISRIKSENLATERDESQQLSETNGGTQRSDQQLRFELEQISQTLAHTRGSLAKVQADLESKSLAYDSLLNVANSEKAEIERQVTVSSVELSKTKRQLSEVVEENIRLKESVSSKEMEMADLEKKLKELETEHKTVVEEFRIKGSGLILENSKLKEELQKLHVAFDEARASAERSAEKFNDLQKMYETLIRRMESKEEEFAAVESQKATLDGLLKAKDAVLGRLCSNFNELLAIFRECQDLGLDRDSSATDIDDGFIRLKRRLLDLSQDYITLNNRNKVLEKEATAMTAKLKEKEHEGGCVRKKLENKCEKLQRTLEKLEEENKVLVSQKIDQDDALRKMKSKLRDLELQEAKGCQDCNVVRSQLQQLQIDLADKDAAISTLELHIQSCCEYNRKKAQQYKHELHAHKRQMEAHSSYAVDFGLSPKKSKALSPRVDVGVQSGESFLHHHTGGFVERFKIRDLEEKVIKLEKERTVLKRLCKVRSDRIHELESQASQSNSLGSK